MAILLAFVLGLIIGLVLKGITVNIVHKSVDNVDKSKEYNQSLAPLLPAEVQDYYKSTQGQNLF